MKRIRTRRVAPALAAPTLAAAAGAGAGIGAYEEAASEGGPDREPPRRRRGAASVVCSWTSSAAEVGQRPTGHTARVPPRTLDQVAALDLSGAPTCRKRGPSGIRSCGRPPP